MSEDGEGVELGGPEMVVVTDIRFAWSATSDRVPCTERVREKSDDV